MKNSANHKDVVKLKNIEDLKLLFLKTIPNGNLRNKIICVYHNYLEKNDFSTSYKKEGYFSITLKDGTSLKIYDYIGIGFFQILFDGYLKYYTLKKGDIVIDAGSHIGSFTIYASKKVGEQGKVISFEPDFLNFERLLKNIRLNNLKNVVALNKGLWSNDTTLKFNNVSSSLGSSLVLGKNPNNNDIIHIPVVKLDDELERLNIKKVNFIKMDIEAAEIEAIKGCKNILKSDEVNLAIASYHIIDKVQTCILLETLFSDMGYNCKTEYPIHLTTYASKDRKDFHVHQ